MIHIVDDPEYSRRTALLRCGLMILRDECPPNPDRYLCKESEFYDESACERCWSQYLFDVCNGRIRMNL